MPQGWTQKMHIGALNKLLVNNSLLSLASITILVEEATQGLTLNTVLLLRIAPNKSRACGVYTEAATYCQNILILHNSTENYY
jgi:hypothetical protein